MSTLKKRGALVALTLAVGAVVTLAGCSSSSSLSGSSGAGGDKATDSVIVGSANFPENVTISDIYGQALASNGFSVTYKPNIGARAVYLPALQSGEVDVLPEYTGSLLSFLKSSAGASSVPDVNTALTKALPPSLKALTPAKAEDADSIVVTPAYAAKHGISSIEDLKKFRSVTLASNPEFKTASKGLPGLEKLYGLKNIDFKAINDGGGAGTLKALLSGDTDVAVIFTTTPSILDNHLVTLADPKNLFSSEQVVPVVNSKKVSPKLTSVLDKVSAALTTKDLLELNTLVSGDTKTDPAQAAKQWLAKANLF